MFNGIDNPGPGPGHYFLPSTIGHLNHDISKTRSPSFSIGIRLPGLFSEKKSRPISPVPKYRTDYVSQYRGNRRSDMELNNRNRISSERINDSKLDLPHIVKYKPRSISLPKKIPSRCSHPNTPNLYEKRKVSNGKVGGTISFSHGQREHPREFDDKIKTSRKCLSLNKSTKHMSSVHRAK